MKSLFKLTKEISLSITILCFGNVYGMDLVKKINNPEERFSRIQLVTVYDKTNLLTDVQKKAVQEEITKNKNKDLARLFNMGTLPPELQKQVILKFCENDKKLAEECLKVPIGALPDFGWACDVMNGQKKLYLRDEIGRALNSFSWNHLQDTIFTDVSTVFSLAKEIQNYELAYKNEFKDVSRSTLQAIQKIMEKASFLLDYRPHRDCTYTMREKVTWQRFEKYFIQDLGVMIDAGAVIALAPLAIKATSRLIELFLCTKMIRDDLVNANILIKAINEHLALSKDSRVRNYQVPLKSVQDYSDFDFFKMYLPYSFFVFYSAIGEFIQHRPSGIYTFSCILATLFAGWLTCILERENALQAVGAVSVVGIAGLTVSSILRIYFQHYTVTVPFSKISQVLQRTDIEILS